MHKYPFRNIQFSIGGIQFFDFEQARNTYTSIHSPLFPESLGIIKNLLDLFCNSFYDIDSYAVSKLFIKMNISEWKFECVWKPLQSCPFSWRHLSDAFLINLAFYVCCRGQVRLSFINQQIPFSPHSLTKTVLISSPKARSNPRRMPPIPANKSIDL